MAFLLNLFQFFIFPILEPLSFLGNLGNFHSSIFFFVFYKFFFDLEFFPYLFLNRLVFLCIEILNLLLSLINRNFNFFGFWESFSKYSFPNFNRLSCSIFNIRFFLYGTYFLFDDNLHSFSLNLATLSS